MLLYAHHISTKVKMFEPFRKFWSSTPTVKTLTNGQAAFIFRIIHVFGRILLNCWKAKEMASIPEYMAGVCAAVFQLIFICNQI